MTFPPRPPPNDAVVKAFGNLYRGQRAEFPSGCPEADYESRLTAAHPIRPELFDRLYGEWSTLDKFQRTRLVLRLMAAVVHELWERHDASLLVMPAGVAIDAPAVSAELTRYLEEGWTPVIESDIDGPNALPLRLDRDDPNLGRYSATRRVARAMVVKPQVAARQLAADRAVVASSSDSDPAGVDTGRVGGQTGARGPTGAGATAMTPSEPAAKARFYGRVSLEPVRMLRDLAPSPTPSSPSSGEPAPR